MITMQISLDREFPAICSIISGWLNAPGSRWHRDQRYQLFDSGPLYIGVLHACGRENLWSLPYLSTYYRTLFIIITLSAYEVNIDISKLSIYQI